MTKNIRFGLRLAVFNLLITALLGTLMRYKIAFAFPFFNQKYLQEAHYHFAFYGWIAACIYILILVYAQKANPELKTKKYWAMIIVNFLASYGLLIGFAADSFNVVSIGSAIVGILVSLVYFISLLTDLKQVKDSTKLWFLGGLFFAILSAVGVLWLSYMMVTKTVKLDLYLATTYYFLHFQYNGFFLFSCIGFLLHSLKQVKVEVPKLQNRKIFISLFIGCFVGFGLSVLWLDMPVWIFVIIVIATLIQTYGAILLYLLIQNNWEKLKTLWTPLQRFVLFYTGFAFAVKIALQLGSVIPVINKFAFGFRNIVIAYLHLILLMCISTFLIDQIIRSGYFKQTSLLLNGFKLFMLSVFLNEFLLGLMGVFSIEYIAIPNAAEMLFGISFTILLSTSLMLGGMKSNPLK